MCPALSSWPPGSRSRGPVYGEPLSTMEPPGSRYRQHPCSCYRRFSPRAATMDGQATEEPLSTVYRSRRSILRGAVLDGPATSESLSFPERLYTFHIICIHIHIYTTRHPTRPRTARSLVRDIRDWKTNLSG